MANDLCASSNRLGARRFLQRMAIVLRKGNNAADGRFDRALGGLQAFTLSALAGLERRPVFLQQAALIVQMPVGQKLSAIAQRCPIL